MKNYMTVKEASKYWGVSCRRIRKLIGEGRIKAHKMGKTWVIPVSESYPGKRTGRPRKVN